MTGILNWCRDRKESVYLWISYLVPLLCFGILYWGTEHQRGGFVDNKPTAFFLSIFTLPIIYYVRRFILLTGEVRFAVIAWAVLINFLLIMIPFLGVVLSVAMMSGVSFIIFHSLCWSAMTIRLLNRSGFKSLLAFSFLRSITTVLLPTSVYAVIWTTIQIAYQAPIWKQSTGSLAVVVLLIFFIVTWKKRRSIDRETLQLAQNLAGDQELSQ